MYSVHNKNLQVRQGWVNYFPLDTHSPPPSAGPIFFFLEQGMRIEALLTRVGQPDIVETIHLSRTCTVLVTRLL